MLRALWPTGLVPLVIWLAALFLGADQPAASLVFSALLLMLGAALLVGPQARISPLALLWITGAATLYALGLLRGWASTGAGEYASLMAGAAVFLVGYRAGRRTESAQAIWTLILTLGALLGLAGFIDFFVNPDTVFGYRRTFGFDRLSAPFLSANTAATFYGMIALMALSSLLKALQRGGRIEQRIQRLSLPAATLLICASCLFLSGSRAGVSLFMVTALMLVGWDRLAAWRSKLGEAGKADARRSGLRGLVGPALLIIVGLLIFGISGDLYIDRIGNRGLFVDTDARAVMFARYVDGVWLAPLLGAGLGGFEFINDFLATGGDERVLTAQNAAHNVAFQWLLQTGVLGATAALGVLALIVNRLRTGLARRRRQRPALRTLIIIAVFVLAHGMVDYALEIPAVFWCFALLLGLGVGIADGGRSSRKSAKTTLPLQISVILVLILSGGLSAYSASDRIAAMQYGAMSDAAFRQSLTDHPELTGSAVRLEAIGDRALRLQAPDLALARAAFQASLAREPRNGKVWAKAAYANYAIIPVMAGETADALRQSYYLMPYADRTFITWRLDFMASAWGGLPADLRDSARREARILPETERIMWQARIEASSQDQA